MLRYIFFSLLTSLSFSLVYAQQANTTASPKQRHLRISILTGSPGADNFETFGHTSIRVIDSTKNGGDRDVIYNYGFFEAYEGKNILTQFLTGRVRVLLDTITYNELIVEYQDKKRGLTEQQLLLNDDQKERLVTFLNNNLSDRYYYYDGSYDNCTTRTRDMLNKVLGNNLKFGEVIPQNSRITFREASTNTYCPQQHKYWYGLLLNIFYASRTDKILNNSDAMFLAAYLDKSLGSATLDGHKLTGEKNVILEDKVPLPAAINQPFILFLVIALFTIAGLSIPRLHAVGKVMSLLLLFTTGLLGCTILYMWLFDHEPGWKDNFNILWALPTNLIVPFLAPKIKRIYGIVAICLLAVALLVSVSKLQVMPLYEIGSIWIALLYVYFTICRNPKAKTLYPAAT